ncbi:MAG TPA: formylglycine-generating enzyme family protein [Candidatus Acidoferrum sp.]|nr:formylglycine-generating enzyme family protein [Candidatus Acidoferrum sp.]
MIRTKSTLMALAACCILAPSAFAQQAAAPAAKTPEMVTIPAGQFLMGSTTADGKRVNSEGPQHQVNIKRFAIGKYDVTFDEWAACVAAGGCNGYQPDDRGWGRGKRPVIYVSWNDAQNYVKWLSRVTGKSYRLPTEAEWEYATRAGTTTPYYWGYSASHDHANYGADDCCQGLKLGKDEWINTSPVGSFPPNQFGLYDMVGNVYQWVLDCAHNDYTGAPGDGSAWQNSGDADCDYRGLRGGSWYYFSDNLRSAMRFSLPPTLRFNFIGFRVVQDLP